MGIQTRIRRAAAMVKTCQTVLVVARQTGNSSIPIKQFYPFRIGFTFFKFTLNLAVETAGARLGGWLYQSFRDFLNALG